MLEMMLESHALYVAMGILAAVGILSKCMAVSYTHLCVLLYWKRDRKDGSMRV